MLLFWKILRTYLMDDPILLFDPTVLWLFREEMMLETSWQSVVEIKNESLFVSGRNSKNFFLMFNRELDI